MSTDGPVRQLQCTEIIGGNQAVRQAVRAPGLDVWLECRPHQSDAGGDIHYFSMCGSGRVTRLVIADVAGHGAGATELAVWLRRQMRRHINVLDQRSFARRINRELASRSSRDGDGRFATVALLTYFSPTDHLIVCNAGHPPPMWYSQRLGEWRWLEADAPDRGTGLDVESARYKGRRVANLPLGVLDETAYVQFSVKLSPGDIVYAYTDGIMEARNPAGGILGREGLLAMAEAGGVEGAPQDLAGRLLDAVQAYRQTGDAEDDLTVAAIRHTADEAPPMSLDRLVQTIRNMIGLHRT